MAAGDRDRLLLIGHVRGDRRPLGAQQELHLSAQGAVGERAGGDGDPLVRAGPQRHAQRVPERVLAADGEAEQAGQVQAGAPDRHAGRLHPGRAREAGRAGDRRGGPGRGQARILIGAGRLRAQDLLIRGRPPRGQRLVDPGAPLDAVRHRPVGVALAQHRRVARPGPGDHRAGPGLVQDAVAQVDAAQRRVRDGQRRRGGARIVLADGGDAVRLEAVQLPGQGQVAVIVAVAGAAAAVAPQQGVGDRVRAGLAPEAV